MDAFELHNITTIEESQRLNILAGNVFRPRAPISIKALFAGRWEQLTTISDAVSQPGLHIVIYGERGVGKTSLANVIDPLLGVLNKGDGKAPRLVAKVNTHQGDTFPILWNRVFEEISWQENKPTMHFVPQPDTQRKTLSLAFGLSNSPTIDDVRRVLSRLSGSVFIFDEFDRGNGGLQSDFTDLIKSLSDYSIDATIVIVGVAGTIDRLVKDHASIVRSIIQIHLPRMRDDELNAIIDIACKEIGVFFDPDASRLVVATSQGLPHYTHLIGLNATRAAIARFSKRITPADVHKAFETCVKQALQTIQESYQKAIRSAHKDALYEDVVLACALASSSAGNPHGEFYPADVVDPLAAVTGRANVKIATFQGHLAEFCEARRGSILVKDGSPRAYKYRFHEPLLPPFIYMTALQKGRITALQLSNLTLQNP